MVNKPMTPNSSLQWAQLQDAFAAGDVLAADLTTAAYSTDLHQPSHLAGQQRPARVVSFAAKPVASAPVMPANLAEHSVSIGLLFSNIERYNRGERGDVEQQLAQLVPVLAKIGWFDLFSPAEWVRGENAGRRLVGLFAGQYLAGPQK